VARCGSLIFFLHPVRIDRGLAEVAKSRVALAVICVFGAWPLTVWVGSYPWFYLEGWNPRTALVIGSSDRAWLGTIYYAAIYDQAMTGDVIG
jgi:hypothetical protein